MEAGTQPKRRPSRAEDPSVPSPEGDERPDIKSAAENEDASGRDLIRKAASSEELDETEQTDALEWFLSDEEDLVPEDIEINVGSRSRPNWIKWAIIPVDQDVLRNIRRQATAKQSGRRGRAADSEVDEGTASAKVVVAGTAHPDLKAAAKQKNFADPSDAVKERFQRKPGLIVQISGQIMDISGYDEEDVRTEPEAASG